MESEESRMEQQHALHNIPMEVSRERVESLWRQVLNQKSSARSEPGQGGNGKTEDFQ